MYGKNVSIKRKRGQLWKKKSSDLSNWMSARCAGSCHWWERSGWEERSACFQCAVSSILFHGSLAPLFMHHDKAEHQHGMDRVEQGCSLVGVCSREKRTPEHYLRLLLLLIVIIILNVGRFFPFTVPRSPSEIYPGACSTTLLGNSQPKQETHMWKHGEMREAYLCSPKISEAPRNSRRLTGKDHLCVKLVNEDWERWLFSQSDLKT